MPQRAIVALLTVAAIAVVATELLGMVALPGFNAFHIASYGLRLALLAILLCSSRSLRIDYMLAAFAGLMIASSLLSDAPAYFGTLRLSVMYVLSMALVAPLLSNKPLAEFRRLYWKWLLALLVAFTIVNFALYVAWRLSDAGSVTFRGLFKHHNELSICAALASLTLLWYLLRQAATLRAPGRGLLLLRVVAPYLVLVMTVMLTCAGGSRAALLALLLGSVAVFALSGIKGRRWLYVAAGAAGIAAVLALQSGTLFRPYIVKMSYGVENQSMTYSRDELWHARWQEFLDKPLTGIGFGVSTHFSDTFDKPQPGGERRSEAGSSWLRLLSNVGIFGFALFAAFNVSLCRILYRRLRQGRGGAATRVAAPNAPPLGLYLGLWVMLIVHGCFDGWFEYVRGVEFFMYWLLASEIYSLRPCRPAEVERILVTN